MEITYDWKYDILGIYFKADAHAVDSTEIEPGVTLDLDEDGHLVAMEIMDARERYGLDAVETLTVSHDTAGALRHQRPQKAREVRPGDPSGAKAPGEQWISVAQAAQRAGVSVQAVRRAIKAGRLAGAPVRPGAKHLAVAVSSLDHWQPNPVRQAAGKARARKVTQGEG